MAEKFKTIVADPPWRQTLTGKYLKLRHKRRMVLPYPTMTVDEICALPVAEQADIGCHLWLWTTNEFIEAGFSVMRAWGFKYLAPIVWVKPSGCGNYFIHRTQMILFGYKERCVFPKARYIPNVIFATEGSHSEKPAESYGLIEAVSDGPYLELFARRTRLGWSTWGNEALCHIELTAETC